MSVQTCFPTVMTVLDQPETVDSTLAPILPFARATGAHLRALSLGVDATQAGYFVAGATAAIMSDETLQLAREDALEIKSRAEALLEKADISFEVEATITQSAGLGSVISANAHFADLVILPVPYGPNMGSEAPMIAEAALFDGAAPVLVVPNGVDIPNPARRIVIAWNNSAEALSAVRHALGLLKAADEVDILVIDPERGHMSPAEPGADLATWLSRHGVHANISLVPRRLGRVSDEIARHLTDTNADLLVMGAYSHSRLREAIWGGATRDLLAEAKLPILMAH